MFYLQKPNFTISDTYPTCIALVSDDDTRAYLEKLSPWVYLYAKVYDIFANQKN